MNTSITLQQANQTTLIDPDILRPNVPASERLAKWLPALTTHSILPENLLIQQKELALSSFAPSTLATYGTGLAKYHNYCDTIQLPEINRTPYHTNILAGFITFLSSNYSKSAIINFISAVRAWHLINNIPYDVQENTIKILLQGAAKVQPLPRPKCQPLTKQHLSLLLQNLDCHKHEQAAVAACLTTTFYMCARLGEFTVPSVKAFNPSRHVSIVNVLFQYDRYFNKVTVFQLPVTKQAPTGEAVFWATQSDSTDPQAHFLNHLTLNEPSPGVHLFCFKTPKRKIPLTRSIFLRNIAIAASKAQIEFQSGHSLRIGATLEYLLRGVPFDVVKQIGRWSSNSFTLYLREHGRILAPYIQEKPNVNSDFIEYTNILLC